MCHNQVSAAAADVAIANAMAMLPLQYLLPASFLKNKSEDGVWR